MDGNYKLKLKINKRMGNQVILFYSFLRPVAVIPDFFIDKNDFPELDLNKTFYYIHTKELPGGLSRENIFRTEVRNFFFRLLTQLYKFNCVHNCEDHSSFDFISAVLIYDLFHIHLPKHDIFTCENNMLSSHRAFRCQN